MDLLLIREVLEHDGIPTTPRLSDVERDTQEFESDSTVENVGLPATHAYRASTPGVVGVIGVDVDWLRTRRAASFDDLMFEDTDTSSRDSDGIEQRYELCCSCF